MKFEPLFFERNRVGRVYTGGKLFAGLFGDEAVDGFMPEEWIASAVRALNKDSKGEKEGVSKVLDSDLYFDELLENYKTELLGEGKTLRILVKALDSAIRLPAQVHPDKPFSRKYLNSDYGKTECWTILDTREDAKIFFGFKDGVTREDLEKAIDLSETDMDAMENLLEYIVPKKDEVYLVPAKTVHAIGKGCLILEVQEPTDFTIQPEHFCGDYKLNDQEMYLGLPRNVAVDCFDFGKAPDSKVEPILIYENKGAKKYSVINEKHTDCFIINRIVLAGGEDTLDLGDNYAIYIVTEGEGILSGEGYERQIKKGDYFFMPAVCMGKYKISGNLTVTECY